MDSRVDERDFRLLEEDRYTYSVLSCVLRGPCNCVLTDHRQLILCHTVAPYPVWLWTPDHIAEEEMERAWQLACTKFPLAEGFRYNLKYELAEYFIGRAREMGVDAHIATNLYAYDCPEAIPPEIPADGDLYVCTQEDVEEAAALIREFYDSVNDGVMSDEQCRAMAQHSIDNQAFFLWKNADGKTVACCSRKSDGALGCVCSVYTKPAYRRRHYAQHMVYRLTQRIAGEGLQPMLYTDADYAASNACYEKIGYVLRGKLCTIAAR